MRIASSLPGFYEKAASSSSNRIADERKEKSLTIAGQLDRMKQEFKVNSLLTTGNKQAAERKAAVLKQRLDQLKAMMRFATPEMAKALARELKGIAKELASLGKAVGASASGTTSEAAAPAGVASDAAPTGAQTESAGTAVAAGTAASVESGQAAPGSGEQKTDEGQGATGDAKNAEQAKGGVGSNSSEDDKSLRETIQEARKLLKELIARLKALARAGDADAKRDLQAAEKSVSELDRALEQGGAESVVTSVDVAASVSVGGNIDVTA